MIYRSHVDHAILNKAHEPLDLSIVADVILNEVDYSTLCTSYPERHIHAALAIFEAKMGEVLALDVSAVEDVDFGRFHIRMGL